MPLAVLGLALAGCDGKAPASAAAQAAPHSVTLSWTASVSHVSGYRVFRTTDPNARPGLVGVTLADTTQFVDTKVEAGRTYYYSVKAFDAADRESEFSAKVSATIPAN
jgi:fibronectin type 3 domain-containing protein